MITCVCYAYVNTHHKMHVLDFQKFHGISTMFFLFALLQFHVHYVLYSVVPIKVKINLRETETIWFLDIPGTCVALDSDEAQLVKTRNEAYKEVTLYVIAKR